MELLGALPQLVSLVEKGGVVGVLILVAAVLIWDRLRLMKELRKTYNQRDKWRLAYVKCKSACDNAGVKVDLSDLADLVGEAA